MGIVALRTGRIAFGFKLCAVRIMTVAAAHTSLIHPTLQKRAVDIDLVEDLPVGMIKLCAQRRRQKIIEQRSAMAVVDAELLAPGVATGTLFDLIDGVVTLEIDYKAAVCGIISRRIVRAFDMDGTRTVTGLAADIDLAPAGSVTIRLHVVTFFQIRRVTFGAHAVPVLIRSTPV